MPDPLQTIRDQVHSAQDAIRWACVLEASSPKAGNVHPSQSFDDLSFQDFVQAAQVTADRLPGKVVGLSDRMLDCVRQCRSRTGTNVNLGIVLLLGPLCVADATDSGSVTRILASLDGNDGANLFAAISEAGAGGLDRVDSLDVNDTKEPVDIVAAMKLAADRDRVALQYATNYQDLLDNVVPLVVASVKECGDVLAGIARAHVRLLAEAPDSLIARKNGAEVAHAVQQRARSVNVHDATSVAEFDCYLRTDGNRLNPGTTADLIAAALFVLLNPEPSLP
ncbi:ATP:dephospho-CoA triphosphoribosyl transferase [Rubripirellula amarantea]|uniref:ATP:dephospho-CoA triphosphoribosyl transferase n=1 Tax=Rubripirellula amarantea TaxID=2527999 RepID=A0A5C5WLN8_9BACT|nr:triphosphoribosyl-dephospho-CoA synthase [Rubripirellula amarantea]TWT51085.1 ATP:dephospho-CoA triphosphoribosyl transferase [Rubripirellula amarantea]